MSGYNAMESQKNNLNDLGQPLVFEDSKQINIR